MGAVSDMVGGLFGGADAAGNASDVQQRYLERAIEEFRSGQTGQEALWNPYVQFGQQGLSKINALNSGDYSGFMNSPDYNSALQQGNQALGQNQAARGNLFSGGAGRELAQYNQGLATQNLGQYRNALNQQVGYGMQGTGAQSNALMGTTRGIADLYGGIGGVKGSGYVNEQQGHVNDFNNILGVAGTIGSFFSDRRLKSNVKRVGTHPSGLPWYSYEMFGTPSEGVMADEVEAVKPDAVSVDPSGFKVVNYGRI